MRARRWLWLMLLCVAIVASVIAWRSLTRADPLGEEVDRLVSAMPTRGKQATIDDLWGLGPRVIPHLARNARQHDTALLKAYRIAHRKLPKAMRTWFKPPKDRGPIRAAAMEAIADLGPLAAWGARTAVVEGMTDPVQGVRVYAEYTIEWLVPEYPPALKAYARILADTNQLPLGNLTVSEPMWSKTPSLVPLLTRHLVQPEHAGNAAIALRFSGSNGVPAVPSLIQTLDHGYAAPSTNDDFRSTYTSLDHNRAMAAQALGAIGVATPEVVAALARAWNNSDWSVRASAANAIGMLSSNVATLPAELIAGLDDHLNATLSAKLNALARLGPAARGALEAVEKFSDTNYVRQWVSEPNINVMYWRVEDIALAATMAIWRIAPERCRASIPEMATHIGQDWLPFLRALRELHGYSNEVINAVEPLLTVTNDQGRSTWAAYVILGHNRNHPGAIGILQRNKVEGATVTARMVAAERLFDSTGDTNGMWEIIENGLSPDSKLGQWSIALAGKMGPPAIPILRRSLWHKDHFVRQYAGIWLRKLAPEELKLKPSDLR